MVADFREKPQDSHDWINGGYFVVEPDVLDLIEDDAVSFEAAPLSTPRAAGPARGLPARRLLDADGHRPRARRAQQDLEFGERTVVEQAMSDELTERGSRRRAAAARPTAWCRSSTSTGSRCPTRWRTRRPSPSPTFPLHLRVCPACGLGQIGEYVLPERIFGAEYPYLSSVSTSWVAHAGDYARHMVDELSLTPGDLVMEVASNDGYLLTQMQRARDARPGHRAGPQGRRDRAQPRRRDGQRRSSASRWPSRSPRPTAVRA